LRNEATISYIHAEMGLGRAENLELPPSVRSGILHDLMDFAETKDDHRLWNQIGWVLVRASKRDDLSTQVSDHFVDHCPDQVFRSFATSNPSRRFKAWKERGFKLRP
jgi:hypothetical protein